MSDLQASLIVIGVTIIGGVWLYNRVQERNFRKRLDRAFGEGPADVLMPGAPSPGPAGERVEPHLEPAAQEPEPDRARTGSATGRAGPHAMSREAAEPDPEIECVAGIESQAPLPEAALEALPGKLAACGRPCRVLGHDAERDAWEPIVRGAPGRYRRVAVALQLVNRSGSVNATQLAMFCDAVRACAAQAGGGATLPDSATTLQAARELDVFCSGVDVAIGINIVAAEGDEFSGERIRELAVAAGSALEPDGVFRWRDGGRHVLFGLDNRQPEPFVPGRIGGLSTRAVTLTLDVPLTAEPPAVFARMLGAARELAAALGGSLVDDNNAALTEAGVARIDEQLRTIEAGLAARGVPAGGPRAQRLFS